MTLHPDEQEILSSNGNKIILTNQRIQLNYKEWGSAYSITLFLEDISSIQMLYRSNKLWLAAATLSFLYSILSLLSIGDEVPLMSMALVSGLVFLGLWALSRKHVIVIAPNGGKSLRFQVNSISEIQIENFMAKLQWAKAQRINQLYKL